MNNNLKTFLVETGASGADVGAWIGKSRQLIYYWAGKANNVSDEIMDIIYRNYMAYTKERLKWCEQEAHYLKLNHKAKKVKK